LKFLKEKFLLQILAERGLITFDQKVSRARDAGAIGVIVYNNLPGGFQGNLSRSSNIPAVSFSKADGRRMVGLISGGEVKVTISLAVEANPSWNVVAEKPGSGRRTSCQYSPSIDGNWTDIAVQILLK